MLLFVNFTAKNLIISMFDFKQQSAESLHLKFCRVNLTVFALSVLVCQACAGEQARWFYKSSCYDAKHFFLSSYSLVALRVEVSGFSEIWIF